MSWDASSDATGYIIYRQKSGDGDIAWIPTGGVAYTTTSDVTGGGGTSSAKIIYVRGNKFY